MRNHASETEIVDVKVPILFLTFNRPDETRATFQAIRESKPQILFIASDGPREGNTQDVLRVAEVRKIIQDVDWDCSCEYLLRDSNLGCGRGPANAIDWFFSKVESGIILEDDCLATPSFFMFCQEMLSKYQLNDQIMAIAGTNIVRGVGYDTDYVYTNFPIMWGWATWRRAWIKYNFFMKEWPRVKKEKSLGQSKENKWKCHPVYTEFFDRTYEKVFSKNIDVWDHQWIFSNWINDGLTVMSTKNLIQNIGFGLDATHTVSDELGRGNLNTYISLPPYRGPDFIAPHKETDLYISKNWFTATWTYYAKIRLMRYEIVRKVWFWIKRLRYSDVKQ